MIGQRRWVHRASGLPQPALRRERRLQGWADELGDVWATATLDLHHKSIMALNSEERYDDAFIQRLALRVQIVVGRSTMSWMPLDDSSRDRNTVTPNAGLRPSRARRRIR